jgi:putative FmdB family regulatory protein
MPLYEYYCESCKRRFELLRPVSRMDDPAVCPQGHVGANRVLSTFAAFTQRDGGASEALAGTSACTACTASDCTSCTLN